MIGAGAAGLSAAAEISRRGMQARVIERSDRVGASWERRYSGLRLNTVRWLSAPRHSRMPRAAGRWPSREALVDHLREYADRKRIEIEFGTTVERIDRADSGFELQTSAGVRRADFVVVATGYDHSPRVPPWSGRDGFTGELFHAFEYRDAEQGRGKDVLVIGAGNTGTEIAVQLLRTAARVRVAMRTPPNIVPLELLGAPITLFARLSEAIPVSFVDLFGAALQRSKWGDLTPYGLSRPPLGIGGELRARGLGPVVDRGFVSALKAGEIEVVSAVQSFDGPDVHLQGGDRIQPQVAIAATGYRMGLVPLVGHLGVLQPSGKPICVRGEANPAVPGLHFNGFWLPASGQLPAMRRSTRTIGREIDRLQARTGGR